METRKTLHVVPADNVEALNICWVVFSSSANLDMCGAVQTRRCRSQPTLAGACWRGASRNPGTSLGVGHISGPWVGCAHGVVTAAPVFHAQDA